MAVFRNPLWTSIIEKPEGARHCQPAEQLGHAYKSIVPIHTA